jgi:membrane fusion protein, multidrug efflux system
MNANTMKLPVLFIALAGPMFLSACGNGQAGDSNANDGPPPIPVEVVSVRRGSVTAFYSTTATLEADREARVVPRLGGNIVELYVEEGDAVSAGQPMARIDNDRYRLELSRAEATMRRLEQDFNRSREMFARDLISAEAFERAKFEFEAQQASFELAQLELSYTEITSPIDGVVSERMIRVGNMVSNQEPVFVVTSMDPLLATLNVPERELARLAAGQAASIAVDALGGRRFEGRIQRISPVIDADSGTFRVTVEVSGEEGLLKPGMFGRVSIVYDTREDTLMVPVEAVIVEDARSSVFVIIDGKAERRIVTTGYRNNGEIEVRSGIEAGESVVVTGQASLRNDSAVSVIGAPEATETEGSVAE